MYIYTWYRRVFFTNSIFGWKISRSSREAELIRCRMWNTPPLSHSLSQIIYYPSRSLQLRHFYLPSESCLYIPRRYTRGVIDIATSHSGVQILFADPTTLRRNLLINLNFNDSSYILRNSLFRFTPNSL